MSERRSRRELVKWVAITLLILPILYFGAYYATVKPRDVFTPDMTAPEAWVPIGTYSKEPQYSIGDFVTPFFAPAHAVDQRLRPNAWKPLENP